MEEGDLFVAGGAGGGGGRGTATCNVLNTFTSPVELTASGRASRMIDVLGVWPVQRRMRDALSVRPDCVRTVRSTSRVGCAEEEGDDGDDDDEDEEDGESDGGRDERSSLSLRITSTFSASSALITVHSTFAVRINAISI